MTKAEWSKDHARQRMKQRYGISLTSREYDRICKAIINNKSKSYKYIETEYLGRISKWKGVYKIIYHGKETHAIYSYRRHNIDTFYPKEDVNKLITMIQMCEIAHPNYARNQLHD